LRGPVGSRNTGTGDPVDQPIVFVIDDGRLRASLAGAAPSVRRSRGADFSSAREFREPPRAGPPRLHRARSAPARPERPRAAESLIQERRDVPTSSSAVTPTSRRASGPSRPAPSTSCRSRSADQALLDIIQRALRNDREARKERAELAAIRQRFDTLTPRERDVLGLVVQGRLNKQIAGDLGISEKTVEVPSWARDGEDAGGLVAELVRQSDRLGLWPQA